MVFEMRFVWLAVGLGMAACGEPLVSTEYLGTPELTVSGGVIQADTRVPSDHGEVKLSLLWIGTQGALDAEREQQATLGADLGEYTMTLFDPPAETVTTFSDLMIQGRLGLAVIVLYADADGSGRLEIGEDVLLGASAQHVVGWSSRPIEPDSPAALLAGEGPAGYRLYELDVESRCRFVSAEACPGEGQLIEVGANRRVALTLWRTAESVVVPAPKLTPNSSVSVWGPK